MQLFGEQPDISFEEVALQVFHYQADNNEVYREYLNLIGNNPAVIVDLAHIPLMPIDFYKHKEIKTGKWESEQVFLSSGTGNQVRSKQHLRSASWYREVTDRIFMQAGFDLSAVQVLGLLPNYLEAGQSSLVHMVNDFVQESQTAEPQFFLYDHQALANRIGGLLSSEEVVLFGVTFALLDFAQSHCINSDRLKIIFTGGMKNRQEELLHSEVVARLKSSFPSSPIYSEYGMTELLSQAYADEGGYYNMPSSLRVITKEINDALESAKYGKTGILGMIDLANLDTCSFIMTQDLGRVYQNNTFEVMGRLSDSDLRGCNLLYNPIP